ncbi:MAG: hypothetical protein JWN70_4318 [Planctomycetaceae bacterium]|nr:hypothetical protein [Planctomycetaceae bacterium]
MIAVGPVTPAELRSYAAMYLAQAEALEAKLAAEASS